MFENVRKLSKILFLSCKSEYAPGIIGFFFFSPFNDKTWVFGFSFLFVCFSLGVALTRYVTQNQFFFSDKASGERKKKSMERSLQATKPPKKKHIYGASFFFGPAAFFCQYSSEHSKKLIERAAQRVLITHTNC